MWFQLIKIFIYLLNTFQADAVDAAECLGPLKDGFHYYEGTKSVTASGDICQAWNSTNPTTPNDKILSMGKDYLNSIKNYCRSLPGQNYNNPWCYTMVGNNTWGVCDLQFCKINGGWSNWTSCESTCVPGGNCTKTRTCTNPRPAYNGEYCSGPNNISVNCPINGMWSNWTSCESICATAGVNNCTKTRTCTNPMPQYNGTNCSGLNTINERCPIHGMWSNWTSCEEVCVHGVRNCAKTRNCTNPRPQFGGRYCIGNTTTENCPIKDGKWSDWTSCESVCDHSLSCTKTRTCTNPTPLNGGHDCPGLFTAIEICETRISKISFVLVMCVIILLLPIIIILFWRSCKGRINDGSDSTEDHINKLYDLKSKCSYDTENIDETK